MKYILILIAFASLGACTSNAEPAKVVSYTTDVPAKKQPVKNQPVKNQIDIRTGRLLIAVQCSATTKTGSQCKRKTKTPEGLCVLHYH
jgi:hypothetical protein